MKTIQDEDLILIIHDDKKYLKRASPGKSFHGKGGILQFSDLIGRTYGMRIGMYDIYEPTIEDMIMYGVKRETQIVYPKDAMYICFKLNLKDGSRLLEAGTGSGALTCVFSRAVGESGTVVTCEKEERHFKNARKNIERFSEHDNVVARHGDLTECEERGFDAVFIDVREPWHYLDKARECLEPSGLIGMIVPTANQVSEILKEIGKSFGAVEVIEVMLRRYKTVAERFRPEDRMVAHTGYLIFARKLDGIIIKAANDEK